jgi:hypothetical protein
LSACKAVARTSIASKAKALVAQRGTSVRQGTGVGGMKMLSPAGVYGGHRPRGDRVRAVPRTGGETALIRDPQERACVERGPPGRDCPKQNPARWPTPRQAVPQALDRIRCPKPDQGEDAICELLCGPHRREKRSRQTAEIQIHIALMNASTPSALPTVSAWPEADGETGCHASGLICATRPEWRGLAVA